MLGAHPLDCYVYNSVGDICVCGVHLRFLSLVAAMAAPFFALLFPIYIKFPILLLLLLLLVAVVRISRSTKREREKENGRQQQQTA